MSEAEIPQVMWWKGSASVGRNPVPSCPSAHCWLSGYNIRPSWPPPRSPSVHTHRLSGFVTVIVLRIPLLGTDIASEAAARDPVTCPGWQPTPPPPRRPWAWMLIYQSWVLFLFYLFFIFIFFPELGFRFSSTLQPGLSKPQLTLASSQIQGHFLTLCQATSSGSFPYMISIFSSLALPGSLFQLFATWWL